MLNVALLIIRFRTMNHLVEREVSAGKMPEVRFASL